MCAKCYNAKHQIKYLRCEASGEVLSDDGDKNNSTAKRTWDVLAAVSTLIIMIHTRMVPPARDSQWLDYEKCFSD